jgi:hypothetical protein
MRGEHGQIYDAILVMKNRTGIGDLFSLEPDFTGIRRNFTGVAVWSRCLGHVTTADFSEGRGRRFAHPRECPP